MQGLAVDNRLVSSENLPRASAGDHVCDVYPHTCACTHTYMHVYCSKKSRRQESAVENIQKCKCPHDETHPEKQPQTLAGLPLAPATAPVLGAVSGRWLLFSFSSQWVLLLPLPPRRALFLGRNFR